MHIQTDNKIKGDSVEKNILKTKTWIEICVISVIESEADVLSLFCAGHVFKNKNTRTWMNRARNEECENETLKKKIVAKEKW